MREHIPSHESDTPELVPKVRFEDLEPFVAAYCGYTDPTADITKMKQLLGESLGHLLQDMRTTHPSLVARGSEIAGRINQGICEDDGELTPDVKNFMNCYIVAYGLMQNAYSLSGRALPPDVEQHPWFQEPQMKTVGNIFDGLNMAQLQITDEYPALVAALRQFVALTWSKHNTAFSDGLTAVAAAEMFDAFKQMETAA